MSELISAAEAAASLQVNRGQLDNWRSRNFGPPYFKIGGSVMYDRVELMKWFKARRVEPSSNSPGYKPPAVSRRKVSRSRRRTRHSLKMKVPALAANSSAGMNLKHQEHSCGKPR